MDYNRFLRDLLPLLVSSLGVERRLQLGHNYPGPPSWSKMNAWELCFKLKTPILKSKALVIHGFAI